MKKATLVLLLSGSCLAGLAADAPRNDVLTYQVVVTLANPNAFPDYVVLAYVTGPQLKGAGSFNVYEIQAETPIDKYDPYNEVSVIAVKRSSVKAFGLDAIDFAQLVRDKNIIPASIVDPDTGTTIGDVVREEIVYAITALCNDNVYLAPAKKKITYVDGRVVEKTYIPHPAPRRYTRMATAASVSADDYLRDNGYYFPDRYHPARAFDGVPETAWSENAAGSGVGETISITFTEPVTVDRISVIPGWFDSRFFRKNNRVKSLAVQSDAFKTAAAFDDAMIAQDIPLSGLGKGPFTFKTISFRIADVYKGTDWDDTPIAEVTFYLNGKPLLVDFSRIVFSDGCYCFGMR